MNPTERRRERGADPALRARRPWLDGPARLLSSGDETRRSALVEHGPFGSHEIGRQSAVYATAVYATTNGIWRTIDGVIDGATPRLTFLDAGEHFAPSPNAVGTPDGKAS